MNFILEPLKNSILITGLVMVMMLLIEYVNIRSRGNSFEKIKKSSFRQVMLAALLGLVPGCVGGFAVVSLFTHNILSFGALVTMMIVSSGDESFVMLAMIPKTAIILFAILFVIGIAVGLLIDKFYKVKRRPFTPQDFQLHSECCHEHEHHQEEGHQSKTIRSFTKERILIILGIAIFIVSVVAGILEHEHIEEVEHSHLHFDIFSERWINLIFAGISIFLLVLTVRAGDHFIKEHLWGHVIKKHLLTIFLWTFGALLVIHFGMQYIDITHWLKNNVLIMLLVAVLIGMIPESGPHMVFITMFAAGAIPFSVLLANSIAQDGHSALPLLAESKRGFIIAKAINMLVGLVFGLGFYLAGF